MAEKVAVTDAPGTQAVIVEGKPVGAGAPTEEGKARKEFMDQFEAQAAKAAPNTFADRLADSDLGYYDDNIANKRYITKLEPGELQTVIGTPTHQLRRLPWPTDEDTRHGSLEGVLVLREDGTFYSVPPGVRSLAEVVDPDSGKALVGDVDPKRAKARAAAAEGSEESKAKAKAKK